VKGLIGGFLRDIANGRDDVGDRLRSDRYLPLIRSRISASVNVIRRDARSAVRTTMGIGR
jgi:hypothetical protein